MVDTNELLSRSYRHRSGDFDESGCMSQQNVNLASNGALEREFEQIAQTLARIGAEPVDYAAVKAAGYDIPRLVGGIAPRGNELGEYVDTGQVLTGICWSSPYITQALNAGRDPAHPRQCLETPSQLREFAETHLPEARQILDQIGGVVTGNADPDEIILIHESELFSRKVASITGFDYEQVRDIVYRSYDQIAAVTERYIHHKNPDVTVTHVTMDEDGYTTLVELMHEDEQEIFESVSKEASSLRTKLESDSRITSLTEALNVRMEPRGAYGNAEANATVALLTNTARRYLDSQGVDLAPKTTIVNNHFYIADQNYGRRWWRDRKSMYMYEIQTTPPGDNRGRNGSVLHLGTLSMLNPFSRQFDQKQTYARAVPRFERPYSRRGQEFDHWLDEGLVVPTTQTLNPVNIDEWLTRVEMQSTPAPTVRYLTSSPIAFTVVNFSPELVPVEIVDLVRTLKTRKFTARAKQQVARRHGSPEFDALPEHELGPELGNEVRTRADELRASVWEHPPAKFYAAAFSDAKETIKAMYSH